MKHFICCLFFALSAAAEEPVFPGAMGFGIYSPAGRGGQVIKVTTLDATGPGSLVEALQTKGPRIIVFEVGGIIDLELRTVRIREPYLTIAGQTAPSPGITIIKGGFQILTHDVLMQHIRIRTGDADKIRVPWDIDAVSTVGGDAYNIVMDHCSFSWGTDGTLDISGPRDGPEATSRRVTVSYSIIAETLSDSIHPKRIPHSRATLIHDFCREIALIRNIYAHNDMRSPNPKPGTAGVIVNNLIYNPGGRAIHIHGDAEKSTPIAPEWSIVGNRLISGPSTGTEWLPGYTFQAFIQSELEAPLEPPSFFLQDNDSDGWPLVTGRVTQVSSPHSFWPEGLIVLDVADVVNELTAYAGARAADRDPVDRRIIQDIASRSGTIINSQNDVGGYPSPAPTYRALTVPPDGEIPAWLQQMAREVEGR